MLILWPIEVFSRKYLCVTVCAQIVVTYALKEAIHNRSIHGSQVVQDTPIL
jgi:hypothetical protein